jgi:hypothetical protein
VGVSSPDDPALVDDFQSDRVTGKRPFRREKVYPELQDGMSTFGSLSAARAQWKSVSEAAAKRGQAVRMGHFIAAVELEPDLGFSIEDLNEPDEHLTIWGDPARLAGAVHRIYPATTVTD